MIARALIVAFVLTTLPGLAAAAETNSAHPKVIVVIGGKKSHGPYEHDFPEVVGEIDRELRSSAASSADPIIEQASGNGAAVYRNSCASCHDNAVEQAPPRSFLSSQSESFIVNALT